MATISVSLPSDGSTADAADYNTPITTIVNEINGNLDNANIKAAAGIAGSKLASATVTPTQWTNPYCFKAYASGATTMVDSVATKILFATEVYDYNSNFASSTYTAPVAGVYHFEASVSSSSAIVSPTNSNARIYINGAVAAYGTNVVTPTTLLLDRVSGDFLLAANDTVEIYEFQNSAGNEDTSPVAADTWFSGHLVHAT